MKNLYKKFKNSECGMATLEMMIALALIVLSISAVILVVFGNQTTSVDIQTNNEALYKAESMLEEARATSRQDFNAVNSSTSSDVSGTLTYNKNLNVTANYGGDPLKKLVTSTVSWSEGPRLLAINLSTLLSVFTGGPTTGGPFHTSEHCGKVLPANSPTDWSDPTQGNDLGGTGHTAMNFTGSAQANGGSCVAIYDSTPSTFSNVTLFGDILTNPFNNKKGVGLSALVNETSGKSSLALIVYNNGNSDVFSLSSVDYATGKLTNIVSDVALNSNINGNQWYRVKMLVVVSGSNVSVNGEVYTHSTPTNPNSSTTLLKTITYSGLLPSQVDSSGKVGMIAAVPNPNGGGAVADSSITNFIVIQN